MWCTLGNSSCCTCMSLCLNASLCSWLKLLTYLEHSLDGYLRVLVHFKGHRERTRSAFVTPHYWRGRKNFGNLWLSCGFFRFTRGKQMHYTLAVDCSLAGSRSFSNNLLVGTSAPISEAWCNRRATGSSLRAWALPQDVPRARVSLSKDVSSFIVAMNAFQRVELVSSIQLFVE